MLKRLREFGFALAAYLVAATPVPAVAAPSCDVPLPIIRTVGEAKVLILLDTSMSMNEGVYHDAYDETVTYPGSLVSDQEYYVSTDGHLLAQELQEHPGDDPHRVPGRQRSGLGRMVHGELLELDLLHRHGGPARRGSTGDPHPGREAGGEPVIAASPSCEFGVEVFNDDNGGKIISTIGTPVSTIQTQMTSIQADSWTPLGESMVTALNYWKTTGASAPIKASCEKAFIIMVTDGQPTSGFECARGLSGSRCR